MLETAPLPNSRTRGRGDMGEAGKTKALDEYFLGKLKKKIFKGHMSGQGQVIGQNRHFSPYGWNSLSDFRPRLEC